MLLIALLLYLNWCVEGMSSRWLWWLYNVHIVLAKLLIKLGQMSNQHDFANHDFEVIECPFCLQRGALRSPLPPASQWPTLVQSYQAQNRAEQWWNLLCIEIKKLKQVTLMWQRIVVACVMIVMPSRWMDGMVGPHSWPSWIHLLDCILP